MLNSSATFFLKFFQSELDKRFRHHISAPKLALPGHGESYNPPPEYLFSAEEEKKWNEKESHERRIKVKPQKYSSLRLIPAYSDFTKERFERCLDLYLCPRKKIMKVRFSVYISFLNFLLLFLLRQNIWSFFFMLGKSFEINSFYSNVSKNLLKKIQCIHKI